MITAIVQYRFRRHRSRRLRRAFSPDRARLPPGARADPQAVHLCRGWLGGRRLSMAESRGCRGLLLRSLAPRHRRALKGFDAADGILRRAIRD